MNHLEEVIINYDKKLMKAYKEIERLNNELKLYKDNHEHLNNLLQQKENIIKEVRDKAIEMIANNSLDFMYRQAYKDILEILDKENKE